MLPSLLSLGPIHIYSYGVMIALGGVLSALFWKSRKTKIGIKRDEDFWLMINVLLIGGFLGGRLLFLFEYVRPFGPEFWDVAFSLNRGFSVMGAFVGVVAGVWWYAWRLGLPFLRVLDYVCQAAPLWHAFGRLGCFLAGCCYGRPTTVPWAVAFTNPDSMLAQETPALFGARLHPTQLYEAFGNLAVAALLYKTVLPRIERGALKPGTLAASYFMLYAALRFFEEFYRGDTVPLGFGLTAAQGFCLALAVLGAGLLAKTCIPS